MTYRTRISSAITLAVDRASAEEAMRVQCFPADELTLEWGGNPGLDPAWIERLADAKPNWKILRSRADGLTVWQTE